MATSSPIDSPIMNGLRLSCLLIEEGTPAVREIFDGLVGPDLQKRLKEKKNCMIKYRDGTDSYPKILSKKQYDMLYNYGYGSEKFDLSLLILLINILCNERPPDSTQNWCDTPKSSDQSHSAALVRLRTMRNTIYGHITTYGIEKSKFQQEWQKLANILQRLGVEKERIKRWKSKPFDEKHFEKYKYEMQSLVLNDRYSAEEMIRRFEKMISDNKEKIEDVEKRCVKIQDLIADGNSVQECISQLRDLERSLPQHFAEVKEQVLKTKTTVEATLDQVNEISSTQHGIREDIKNIKIIETIFKEPHTVDMLEEYMSSCKDAYKILVCNSPEKENVNRSDLLDLCQTVMSVSWDLVIDLDHDSCTTGIYSHIAEILKPQKHIKVMTYNETRNVSSDIESNKLGDTAIWVLANGCADRNCDPILEKFGVKSKVPIMQMLCNILKKSPQTKSVFVMVLHQSQEAEDAMKETVSMVMDVIRNSDDTIDVKACTFAQICLGGNSDVYLLDKVDAKMNQVCLFLSCRELVSALGRIYQNSDTKDKYFIPGVSGETYLRQSEVEAISSTMELFHREIGVKNIIDMDPAEIGDRMIKTRYAFHKGNPITPEAIRINAKEQVFVRRDEIDKILEKVEKKMAKMKWNKGENRPLYINHEASGGGTTVATVALFKLRNKHPSVKILKLEDSLYNGLQMLYRISKKGLLVLIDSDTINSSDIESLSKRLENDEIKVQLLVTSRVTLSETDREMGVYVSGTLDSLHMAAFLNLFKEYANIKEANRIFPIGLQAFLSSHSKLDEHITYCLKKATERQGLVLRLVCIQAKYGRRPFSVKLAQAVLQIKSSDTQITESLGYTNDFLLSTRDGDIYLASKCVTDRIFRCVFGNDDQAYWIGEFIKDIHDLIDKSRDQKDDLSHFLYDIFIHDEKEMEGHEIRLPPFIQDMIHCFPQKSVDAEGLHSMVAEHLHQTICKLEGTKVHPHMQALLAMVFMNELKRHEESIALMRAALDLEKDQTLESKADIGKDTHLLIIYGYLLIQSLHLVQLDLPSRRKSLEEAIYASQLAEREVCSTFSQTKNKYSAVSFLQEARARLYLLQHYLSSLCGNDREDFRNFLDNAESDTFIKTCEIKAYIALDKIEFFRSQGKLHDDTTRIIFEAQNVRYDILRLNKDMHRNMDMSRIHEVIEKLPEHVPCDVGSLIRRPISDLQRQKYWEELEVWELIFIYEEAKKRLKINILRCYYIDIISAMIHITNRAQDPTHDKYHIKYALECAENWVSYDTNDHQAHFMLGVLRFILALDDKSQATGVADHFKECHRICSEAKTTDSFRLKRYFIGCGTGLEKIVPNELQARREKESLQVFTGVHQGNNHITISEFPGHIEASVIMPETTKVIFLHKARIRFNLAFSHDGLKAVNTLIQ